MTPAYHVGANVRPTKTTPVIGTDCISRNLDRPKSVTAKSKRQTDRQRSCCLQIRPFGKHLQSALSSYFFLADNLCKSLFAPFLCAATPR